MHPIIPIELKKRLGTREFRNMLMTKYGSDAFLKPKELKYPIYDESGFNCSLCYAAYLRSHQFHDSDIASKATILFNTNKCGDKINVHIHESELMNNISNLINRTSVIIYD